MKITSKILSVVLVLAMALGMFAIVSFAAEVNYVRVNSKEELTSGEYTLRVSKDVAFGAFDGKNSVLPGETVEDSNWTVTVNGDKVKLTDAKGNTIAPQSGKNGLSINPDFEWTVRTAEKEIQGAKQIVFEFVTEDNLILAYNTYKNTNKFRAYKQTSVELHPESYLTQFEMFKKTETTQPEKPVDPEKPAENEAVKTTLDKLTTADEGKLVTVEGLTVKEVKQGTKDPAASKYVFADDKGNEITLFYIKTFENVKQGDTVTVTAYISVFKDHVQFDNKKEVKIVVAGNPTEPDVKPTDPEVKPTEPEVKPTEPEAKPTEPETKPEIPAKSVLSMKIPGKTVYFNGKIVNGRFLGTTTKAAEAVEVVKEAKGDGFYLRIKDGKYISVQETEYKDKKTGEMKKGIQLALTDKAETVYKLDSKLGIMKTTVGKTEYYLGSYTNKEGKTYDTISASKASYVKSDNIGKTQFAAKLTTVGGSAQTGDTFPMVAVVTALVGVSALAVLAINRKKFNA